PPARQVPAVSYSPLYADDLDPGREAHEHPREQEGDDDEARDVEPHVTGRAHRGAEHTEAEPERRARHEKPDDDGGEEGDHEADVDSRPAPRRGLGPGNRRQERVEA